jgi:hypothetical protein
MGHAELGAFAVLGSQRFLEFAQSQSKVGNTAGQERQVLA